MNLSEFKAWFEGFTENLDGPPGEKAWGKIQAKVKEIKDAPPTTYPVFVDRYVRPYWDYRPQWGYNPYTIASSAGSADNAAVQNMANGLAQQKLADLRQWNAADGFRALGAAEAQALASA